MKILDTVVLIGAIREEDRHYEKAKVITTDREIGSKTDTYW